MTRAVRVALTGMFALAALFALVAPGVAGAHAVLVSADPAGGAELTRGPDRVSATFNEQLQTSFAAMTVVGPDGHLWSTGETQVRGTVASVAVRPLGPAGTYTVNYRVTSADGHVVSGSWPFRLTVAGTGEPGPAVTDHGEAPPPIPRRYADPEADLPIWPFVAGAVALVGAGLWLNRRRS
ncbi:copper resistance CopC family protein [Mycolicibacter kumamotonensis]|jgi:methionine-rich copper-binding protein CopC|uniref:Copper resistance protein CopC n=1 Tax=Mycolicibacter kumamotonensis TaxID=354243 RepID=A0A1B8SKN4_9MYCO|nr:copper resistance CopC family protein [Mycolicibacter kumamotonensis]NDJ91143.1 copper resistance protein CopC [Mycolicibacter kumamotonensis]OBY33284.1 copper resistance protein CopC [Mycolicibacter kumamotonensis]